MKRIILGLMSLALLAVASTASAQLIFSDDFDDGNGATRWSAPILALEDPGIGYDGSVDYAFDYSTIGAAPAPNSAGTTIGIAFESNTTQQCSGANQDPNCAGGDEGEGSAVIPLSGLADIPAGDFSLTADVYIFWIEGNGSTEYATLGVHSTGAASPLSFFLDDGDGLAWQFDGDAGSGSDIIRYEDPGTGQNSLGGYEDIPIGSIPNVTTCKAGVTCTPGTPNGPLNQWVEMKISSVGGLVSFSMNGFVIDTFDNTGGLFANGTIMIGGADPFNSVNSDNSAGLSAVQVFDNIVLSVPEPASFVLLGLAGLSLLGVRRR